MRNAPKKGTMKMSVNNENSLIVTDENGNEMVLAILFTFDHPETGESYVVATDPKDEDLVFGFRYDEDNNLIPVDPDVDEEEFNMVAEVLASFADEIDDNSEEE